MNGQQLFESTACHSVFSAIVQNDEAVVSYHFPDS